METERHHHIYDIDDTLIRTPHVATLIHDTTKEVKHILYHDIPSLTSSLQQEKDYHHISEAEFVPQQGRNYLYDQIEYALQHNLTLPSFEKLQESIRNQIGCSIITDRTTTTRHLVEAFRFIVQQTGGDFTKNNATIQRYLQQCHLIATGNEDFVQLVTKLQKMHDGRRYTKIGGTKKILGLHHVIQKVMQLHPSTRFSYTDDRRDILEDIARIDIKKPSVLLFHATGNEVTPYYP